MNQPEPFSPPTKRQPVNPAQLRTSGIIFIAVGTMLAVLFTVFSLMQDNWRFLMFAAAPIAFQLIIGIVYVVIGTRNR